MDKINVGESLDLEPAEEGEGVVAELVTQTEDVPQLLQVEGLERNVRQIQEVLLTKVIKEASFYLVVIHAVSVVPPLLKGRFLTWAISLQSPIFLAMLDKLYAEFLPGDSDQRAESVIPLLEALKAINASCCDPIGFACCNKYLSISELDVGKFIWALSFMRDNGAAWLQTVKESITDLADPLRERLNDANNLSEQDLKTLVKSVKAKVPCSDWRLGGIVPDNRLRWPESSLGYLPRIFQTPPIILENSAPNQGGAEPQS